MIKITIYILIYVLSVISNWYHVKIAHSKGGIYSNLKTGPSEVIFTFFPGVNTFIIPIAWIFFYPKKGYQINFDGLFNIKKKDDK